MAKPSDFYIGVVEFFAVLLPGAALVYLLKPLIFSDIPERWWPTTSREGWVMFLVVAYIAGHLLHALGSLLLDKYVYQKFYLPLFRSPHARASKLLNNPGALGKDKDAANTLLARVHLTTKINAKGTNYYDWCLSDIRVSSNAGALEVDRLQADSKFFRSMAFVFLAGAFLSFNESPPGIPITLAGLSLFANWRFCDLRWTATKRVYEYYLLLCEGRGAADSA